ncbi:MAG: hypothetical protein ACOX0N_11985 [Syntrophomonadaceae bacterium]|jgi:hypothetical protein
MFVNVRGKLVESRVITIEPIGLAMKSYIIERFSLGTPVSEIQVLELRKTILDMESQIKDGYFVKDENILSFARKIEIELGHESNILSEFIQAIFLLSEGSDNNKLVALEQMKSTVDMTLIEILKCRQKGKSNVNYI